MGKADEMDAFAGERTEVIDDEDKMGSIEVGNFADLLIINHEFLTDDPEDIKTAKVERTILGGKTTYIA